MRKITAAEFEKEVENDPAWASKLTQPVEITDYCDLSHSKITHLSPLLHFTGQNPSGAVANFQQCKDLKVAEGTFAGWVGFFESGVEQIGELTITQPDRQGIAADFGYCQFLKIAEGTFPGHVNFGYSQIEKIGKLNLTHADRHGYSANFANCKNLQVAEGHFPGFVSFDDSGIRKIGDLKIDRCSSDGRKANFNRCNVRFPIEFLGEDFRMEDTVRQKNLVRIAASKAHKSQPGMEI